MKTIPVVARSPDRATPDSLGHDGPIEASAEPAPFHEEPLTDFAREDMRQAMDPALKQVHGQLGRDYPAVINNQPGPAAGWLPSLNPSPRSQVVGRFARTTPEHARQAIPAARAAFPGWRDTEPARRAEYLFAA